MPLNAIYGSDIRLLTGAGSDPEFAAVAEAKMYFCILLTPHISYSTYFILHFEQEVITFLRLCLEFPKVR